MNREGNKGLIPIDQNSFSNHRIMKYYNMEQRIYNIWQNIKTIWNFESDERTEFPGWVRILLGREEIKCNGLEKNIVFPKRGWKK